MHGESVPERAVPLRRAHDVQARPVPFAGRTRARVFGRRGRVARVNGAAGSSPRSAEAVAGARGGASAGGAKVRWASKPLKRENGIRPVSHAPRRFSFLRRRPANLLHPCL